MKDSILLNRQEQQTNTAGIKKGIFKKNKKMSNIELCKLQAKQIIDIKKRKDFGDKEQSSSQNENISLKFLILFSDKFFTRKYLWIKDINILGVRKIALLRKLFTNIIKLSNDPLMMNFSETRMKLLQQYLMQNNINIGNKYIRAASTLLRNKNPAQNQQEQIQEDKP